MINTTAKLLILSILWYSKSTSLPNLCSLYWKRIWRDKTSLQLWKSISSIL